MRFILRPQRSGYGGKFAVAHLPVAPVFLRKLPEVPQQRREVSAAEDNAGKAQGKEQQEQQQSGLPDAAYHKLPVILRGDQHRQCPAFAVSTCSGKVHGYAYIGKVPALHGCHAVTHGLECETVVNGNIAVVSRTAGHQTLAAVQRAGHAALRCHEAGNALKAGGLLMMGGEISLVDPKAAQPVYCAVLPDHGNGQQNGPLRGAGKGDQCRGAAGGGRYRRGRIRKALPVIRQSLRVELPAPFPVGHDPVGLPNLRHASVEQQIPGQMLGIAPLDIQPAAVSLAAAHADGGFQNDKGSGAVRLTGILAQRLQQRLLYL